MKDLSIENIDNIEFDKFFNPKYPDQHDCYVKNGYGNNKYFMVTDPVLNRVSIEDERDLLTDKEKKLVFDRMDYLSNVFKKKKELDKINKKKEFVKKLFGSNVELSE